jgi:hypothetical protein
VQKIVAIVPEVGLGAINVGSTHGVSTGDVLRVVRADIDIGTIEVTEVGTSRALFKYERSKCKAELAEGDKVISSRSDERLR